MQGNEVLFYLDFIGILILVIMWILWLQYAYIGGSAPGLYRILDCSASIIVSHALWYRILGFSEKEKVSAKVNKWQRQFVWS